MLTQAEIFTAVSDLLGADLAALVDTTKVTRWFNEGQQRLNYFRLGSEAVSWAADDTEISLTTRFAGIEDVLYPDTVNERRWEPVVDGLIIRDYEGAHEAGNARIVGQVYWPDVTGAVDSELPPTGDNACVSYALHRAYRFFVSNRSVYNRYATMAGQNAVGIEDLARASDDHYRDFLDLRGDLPDAPAATFFS